MSYIKAIWDDDEFSDIHKEFGYSPEKFHEKFETELSIINNSHNLNIREEEYRQFTSSLEKNYEKSPDFEIRKEIVSKNLESFFSHIVRVVRLREVRALCGFTRINPPADRDSATVKLSKSEINWLPAIEVRGEGIFLDLNKETLKIWESIPLLQKRAEDANKAWMKEWEEMHPTDPLPFQLSPRFFLIHSLSHAIIRVFSTECGYSSASLRERLYVSEGNIGMTGILIYTSTTDSDGSLGGLQRLGEINRLESLIISAIYDMEWCSSDPLCIHGMVSARENHSPAACHACLFIPETACEHFNRFLDRATLIGLPEYPNSGFFKDILMD